MWDVVKASWGTWLGNLVGGLFMAALVILAMAALIAAGTILGRVFGWAVSAW